jgi:glycogen operon protein
MLLGGDELGRTQGGNNNAYCQDNEVSWFDWSRVDESLLGLTSALVGLRRGNPVFRRRRFFHGRPLRGSGIGDIGWFTTAGTEMTESEWEDDDAKAIGVFLNGSAIPGLDARGDTVSGDSFLVLLNAAPDSIGFTLPKGSWGESWAKVLDTWDGAVAEADESALSGGDQLDVGGHAALVLRRID